MGLSMMHLRVRIALKAQTRGMQQCWGHGEIALRGRDMHMPQIGREVGQPPLDIGALLIPGHEAMDSRGVAQIVEAGLIPCAVVSTHLGLRTYPAEGPFSLLAR